MKKSPAPKHPAPTPTNPIRQRKLVQPLIWELSNEELAERMKQPDFEKQMALEGTGCRLTPGCVSWNMHAGPCRLARPPKQVLADAKKAKDTPK